MSAPALSESMLGISPAIDRVRRRVARLAPTTLSVLVTGPTGAGKELVAWALHELSGRRGRFVACNVCSLADSLFEDQMFGHRRGAFTGAVTDRPGHLAEADHGTLFLDEIGGLAAVHQAKLLRVLETGAYRPLGAPADQQSAFRVVSACNEEIGVLVDDGRFREDLAQRLSAAVIRVPALRERVEDIPVLAHHFARIASERHAVVARLAPGAITVLQAQAWPGNVRQLKHVVECALVLSEGPIVGAAEIAEVLRDGLHGRGSSAAARLEREHLIRALHAAGGDVRRAAAILGVHRVTVYRRVKRLGVPLPTGPMAEQGHCSPTGRWADEATAS